MKSYIVAGLGFGDEGKGSIVDYLADNTYIQNTIRYNGGHQAAHHVVRNGITHCFSQFGSSMLLPDRKTILSKHMLIEPYALVNEANALMQKGVANPYSQLFIDKDCLIVTPIQKLVNQMREIVNQNGSCGIGIGETISDADRFKNPVIANDVLKPSTLYKKLYYLWKIKIDHAEQIMVSNLTKDIKEKYNILIDIDIDKLVSDYICIFDKLFVENVDEFYSKPSIYEGAQGALLDVEYGFHPHVTKTKTTFENAEDLCRTSYEKVGVLRPYMTRHGNGPLPTQDDELGKLIPDSHNGYNLWQGNFRIGWQDLVLTKYAISISGKPDYIAMTNIDKIENMNKIKLAVSYEYNGIADVKKFFECKKKGKGYILEEIIKNCAVGNGREINNILKDCKPIYKTFHNPNSREEYLGFLESDAGIGIPIDIMSFGPESDDKVSLR